MISYPPLRSILLAVSAAYLLYIAFRIATSDGGVAIVAAERPLRFANGILLQIINPKAYAVMTALFTGFAIHPQNTLVESLVKAAVFTAISVPVHLLWLYMGATLKRLAFSARAARGINIAMALAMIAVVILAVLS